MITAFRTAIADWLLTLGARLRRWVRRVEYLAFHVRPRRPRLHVYIPPTPTLLDLSEDEEREARRLLRRRSAKLTGAEIEILALAVEGFGYDRGRARVLEIFGNHRADLLRAA